MVHMRGACGDSLDHMEGSNYKVYTQPSIYELVELPVPYLCINSMVSSNYLSGLFNT